MKIAFISGPYRAISGGKTVLENIRVAEKYAIKYWRLGYAVLCPHLNSAFMDGICPDETWLEGDLEFIKRLKPGYDVIVAIPEWKQSYGSTNEIEFAVKNGIGIIYES